MTLEKITSVVELYRRELEKKGIGKQRMDPSKTLGSLTSEEQLMHAHYLLDGILEYAKDPEQAGKTGRHLASVQMILSFENWYTLQELMDHNRPDAS